MFRIRIRRKHINLIVLVCIVLLAGCGYRRPVTTPPDSSVEAKKRLKQVRFTLQVGAFTNLDNAVRLTEKLQRQGLNAYHFIDRPGLYKVRFGNYATKKTARREAEMLQARGLIGEFYVVSPQIAAIEADLRAELIRTAQNFIGIPYKWGVNHRPRGLTAVD